MEIAEEKILPVPVYSVPVIMDNCGRILIPASIRRVTGLNPLTNLTVKVVENHLIIEAV